MSKNWGKAILFLLLVCARSYAPACGTCVDTGTTFTCYSDPPTWNKYCTGTLLLWDTPATCSGADGTGCGCGDADPSGPCGGCGYQSKWSPAFCFANSSCTTPCAGLDELPIPEWKQLK